MQIELFECHPRGPGTRPGATASEKSTANLNKLITTTLSNEDAKRLDLISKGRSARGWLAPQKEKLIAA